MKRADRQDWEDTIKGLSTVQKYETLIGMIEGGMADDDMIVGTEIVLDSLLVDLKTKYPVFSPTDSTVEFKSYKHLEEDFGCTNL